MLEDKKILIKCPLYYRNAVFANIWFVKYDVSDNSVEESSLRTIVTVAAAGKRTAVPTFLKIRWVSLFQSAEAKLALVVYLRRVVGEIVKDEPKNNN